MCVCVSHLSSGRSSVSAVCLWLCVRVRWPVTGRGLQAMPMMGGAAEVWSEGAESVCELLNPKLPTQSSADLRSAAESRPTAAPSLELTDVQMLVNHSVSCLQWFIFKVCVCVLPVPSGLYTLLISDSVTSNVTFRSADLSASSHDTWHKHTHTK